MNEQAAAVEIKTQLGSLLIRKPSPFECADAFRTLYQAIDNKDRFDEKKGPPLTGRARTAATFIWCHGWIGLLYAGPNADRLPALEWKEIIEEKEELIMYQPDRGDPPPPEDLNLYGQKLMSIFGLSFFDMKNASDTMIALINEGLGMYQPSQDSIEKARDFFVQAPAETT